jgi:hypothetical protein
MGYTTNMGNPLGKQRQEDNIKMELRKIGCVGVDCNELAERVQWWVVVNTVLNPKVP